MFMITFDFIFNTLFAPSTLRQFIFQLNYDRDTPLFDTPPLDDMLLCGTRNQLERTLH